MYLIIYYVPKPFAEITKNVLFNLGAGRIGNYVHCCTQMEVDSQFKPSENCEPHIGEKNVVNHLKEIRIEIMCDDKLIKKAIKVLKTYHPYEKVPYQVLKIVQHLD